MKRCALLFLMVLVACCHTSGTSRGLALRVPPGGPAAAPVVPPNLPDLLPDLFGLRTEGPREVRQAIDCSSKPCVPVYVFRGTVTKESVQDAIDWMTKAKKAGAEDVVLELDTQGGSVPDGHRLIREIEEFGLPVYCVADHEAMSQAFAILQSCTQRYMTKRTSLMAHQPLVSIQMQGRAQEFRNLSESLRTGARAHAEQCAARLKVSVDEYIRRTEKNQDWYFTWQEALQYGAVDKVVPSVDYVRDALRAGKAP